jgi:UDPglucose 6-dehydrogenase
MRITVIGTGYLGAVHAACLAEIGHDVLGVDADAQKVAALQDGRAPFYEPGLEEMLLRAMRAGRLRFGMSLPEAARFGDVHFICVGTPQLPGAAAADLSCINAVIEGLGPHLGRPCLVVGKSTVPVGTAARLGARIASLAPAGAAAEVAWNPEFLREGHAVQDTLRPDRVVAGTVSAAADATLRAVYAPLLAAGIPYLATDLPTAELVKVAANAFLATKISFINAVSDVCAAAGADITALSSALGADRRIGREFLSAGLGYGGGCLPKDLQAFLARADELGTGESVRFLREVDEVNRSRSRLAVTMARDLAGGTLAGRTVGVLGAAFKPGTDDIRCSPALAVADAVQREGAAVTVHDPRASFNARRAYPALEYAAEPPKACAEADLVLHLTEWPEYAQLDPAELRAVVRTPRILDARLVLPLDRWRAAGWTAWSLGGPRPGLARPAPGWPAPGRRG